jgi:hypothetical protein
VSEPLDADEFISDEQNTFMFAPLEVLVSHFSEINLRASI